jgi:hypothetical protein
MLAIALAGWIAIGLGVLVVLFVLIAIAFYPRDNSF